MGGYDRRTMDDDTVRLHEVYTSLRLAGFTEREGLYLAGLVLLKRLPDALLAKVEADDDDLHSALRIFLDTPGGPPAD